jgi:regulator of replication initiation timing
MSKNKQSSVEWFAKESWKLRVELEDEKISLGEYANKYYQLKEQAKAMHKEEMIEFALNYMRQLYDKGVITAETFYNETFGGNK